jgi:hypothetical protein
VRVGGRPPVGIAKKEEEERGKDEKRNRPGPAKPEPGDESKKQGSPDKGPPCFIDQHVDLRGQAVAGITGSGPEIPQHQLHLIFQVELLFLDSDFFEMIGV